MLSPFLSGYPLFFIGITSNQLERPFGVPEDSVFDDADDNTDDPCSTCDSVYSVGEVSIVSHKDDEDAFTVISMMKEGIML